MYYLVPMSKTSHHINKLGTRVMLYSVVECVYVAQTHEQEKLSVVI